VEDASNESVVDVRERHCAVDGQSSSSFLFETAKPKKEKSEKDENH
jgi:hypothetical protein